MAFGFDHYEPFTPKGCYFVGYVRGMDDRTLQKRLGKALQNRPFVLASSPSPVSLPYTGHISHTGHISRTPGYTGHTGHISRGHVIHTGHSGYVALPGWPPKTHSYTTLPRSSQWASLDNPKLNAALRELRRARY